MSESESQIRLVTVIAEGLGHKPAYLLIFGICVLFFIFGIGAGIYGLNNPQPQVMYWIIACFAGFVVAVIAGVIVIRTVEVRVPTAHTPTVVTANVHDDCIRLPQIGDGKVHNTLVGINRGVKEALLIDNKIFHEAILETCQDFLSQVADWEDGQFKAQNEQYNRILLEFYQHAKTKVFSTSVPDYISAWKGSLGDRIISAHKKSEATVIRVFVFNNRSEVTPEALEEMEAQDKIQAISVRLYFDEEDRNFNFPVDVGRDFTLIDDGEAIGITASFGGSNPTAIWYINDEKRKPRFMKMRNALINGSISFDSFREWSQTRQIKTPGPI